ncbi:hypothetical protein HYH02_013998 [Chlamydomonas schloesseri]|uniref:Uncharacterized protein n=1 Tax=Chlamydomonas schloesseri TaxID=2026947 RepID=A0A835SZI0_9CHLO|nr:hypothetical protein HYH02_013998 [Chlamydomonas schloesseri]|eukprot:KAG2429660.1 hypothetical protein HYH02_013998 [Chlamydomonas schloesseri]
MGCGSSVQRPPGAPVKKAEPATPAEQEWEHKSTSHGGFKKSGTAAATLAAASGNAADGDVDQHQNQHQHQHQQLHQPPAPSPFVLPPSNGPSRVASKADVVSAAASLEAADRASELTKLLAQRQAEAEAEAAEAVVAADVKAKADADAKAKAAPKKDKDAGDELAELFASLNTFPDFLKEMMAAPVQVLLAVDVADAAGLARSSGCSQEEAMKALDGLAVLKASAEALATPEEKAAEEAAAAAATKPAADGTEDADGAAAVSRSGAAEGGSKAGAAAAATANGEVGGGGGGGSSSGSAVTANISTSGSAATAKTSTSGAAVTANTSTSGSAVTAKTSTSGSAVTAKISTSGSAVTAKTSTSGAAVTAKTSTSGGAAAGAGGGTASGEAAATPAGGLVPSPQQLARSLGNLSNLIQDYPGLRTAAMARGAPGWLMRILARHTERAAAANAALALAALAAGPPPHKTSLIASGVVEALLEAMQGKTAAHEAAGGDAPSVVANACNGISNLSNSHAAGAAAVVAAGGIGVVLGLCAVECPAGVRTNAAGILVQLGNAHESYRAAIVQAGGVPALAAGLLRGPDAPACNAATALYNLAALSPPNLRPHMAAPSGPLSIVRQLLLCMAGRDATGAGDESVAAAASARVNASALLLELCKDPAAAPGLAAVEADGGLGVPAALAALAAGRLPPPPPGSSPSSSAGGDTLSAGVELLYPVPTVVRGNALLCLLALARMGPAMQLELGRCGALGTLLELIAPGQDPAMQVNSANALCSLAAANADIHSALVEARCVPLMAGLLLQGGDMARANVCAVFVTMMRDAQARQQLQECGGLSALVRLTAAVMDERKAAGVVGALANDPAGLLCNCVGALAEACKHPELRRAIMQVEFGESLRTLLQCVTDGPEPAQVNAAAALCFLCREQACALQLERLQGLQILKEIVGPENADGEAPALPGGPSHRLRHNARRALARMEDQIATADDAAKAAADRRAAAVAAARKEAAAEAAAAAAAAGEAEPKAPAPPRSGWQGEDAHLDPTIGLPPLPGAVAAAAGAGRASGASAGAEVEAAAGAGGGSGGAAQEAEGEDEIATVISPPQPLSSY